MRKIIISLIIFASLCQSVSSIAQGSFIFQPPATAEYDNPEDMIIKPNGDIIYIYSSSIISKSDIYTNSIYEIDNEGNLVNNVALVDSNYKHLEFKHCYYLDDTLYLFGEGRTFDAEPETYIFMLKLDDQLNVTDNILIDPGLKNVAGLYHGKLKFVNDKFYFLSSAQDQSSNVDPPFSAVISKQGTLLEFGIETEIYSPIFGQFDFNVNAGENGYRVFASAFGNTGGLLGLICFFSDDFQLKEYSILPFQMDSYFTYQPLNDSIYFLSGEWDDNTPPAIKHAGILKLKNDTTVIDSFLHTTFPDSSACPAYRHSLELLPDGNLIFCFTDNISVEIFPELFPTKINLMKLTPDFEVIWHRYIGDGENCWNAYVMRVNDDGVIAIHAAFNTEATAWQRDVLFIKTTPDGLITGTHDDFPGISSTETILYPNPAKDFAIVELSMAYQAATLVISNISGQEVFRANLTGNKQQVDISGVPAGNYVYRIFNEKGLDENGKLVVGR